MTCLPNEALILAVDGNEPGVMDHVSECARCGSLMEAHLALHNDLLSLPPVPVPDTLFQNIVSRVDVVARRLEWIRNVKAFSLIIGVVSAVLVTAWVLGDVHVLQSLSRIVFGTIAIIQTSQIVLQAASTPLGIASALILLVSLVGFRHASLKTDTEYLHPVPS